MCEACDKDEDSSESDDRSRIEATNLSSVRQEMNESIDSQRLSKMVDKAERWLHLCIQLKYKVTHQIEAADALFNICMMVGDVDKASDVAEQGLKLAIIRFGEKNRIVDDWKRKSENPVLYMITI